jgi:hypothetical protein
MTKELQPSASVHYVALVLHVRGTEPLERHERMGAHKQLVGSTMRLQKSELRTWCRAVWWEIRDSTALSAWIYHPCFQEENCLEPLPWTPFYPGCCNIYQGYVSVLFDTPRIPSINSLRTTFALRLKVKVGRSKQPIICSHPALGIGQREKFTPDFTRLVQATFLEDVHMTRW